jgi:type I restriction enzyme M protein
MRRKLHIVKKMPRLIAELDSQFAESAKLEQAIRANLPARRSVQREGGKGLGYGG